METKLHLPEITGTSWRALKSQIWVLAGLYIAYTIISFIINIFTMPASPQGDLFRFTPLMGAGSLAMLFISGLFMLGYVKNLFQTLDGQEPRFSAYGRQASKILTFIVCMLLYSLIVSVGFVLFIIPGIYLALRLQFATAFIVEENTGILESLKMSWRITRGHMGKLFLLAVLETALVILGMLVFLIGIFVAVPLVLMMYCYTYRQLYPNPLRLDTTPEAF